MGDVKTNFHLIFGPQNKDKKIDESVELMLQNIDHYRNSKGLTRKYVYLLGAATMIGAENPAVVQQIADYMTKGRK